MTTAIRHAVPRAHRKASQKSMHQEPMRRQHAESSRHDRRRLRKRIPDLDGDAKELRRRRRPFPPCGLSLATQSDAPAGCARLPPPHINPPTPPWPRSQDQGMFPTAASIPAYIRRSTRGKCIVGHLTAKYLWRWNAGKLGPPCSSSERRSDVRRILSENFGTRANTAWSICRLHLAARRHAPAVD